MLENKARAAFLKGLKLGELGTTLAGMVECSKSIEREERPKILTTEVEMFTMAYQLFKQNIEARLNYEVRKSIAKAIDEAYKVIIDYHYFKKEN